MVLVADILTDAWDVASPGTIGAEAGDDAGSDMPSWSSGPRHEPEVASWCRVMHCLAHMHRRR
jgi:hypothetical protein